MTKAAIPLKNFPFDEHSYEKYKKMSFSQQKHFNEKNLISIPLLLHVINVSCKMVNHTVVHKNVLCHQLHNYILGYQEVFSFFLFVIFQP